MISILIAASLAAAQPAPAPMPPMDKMDHAKMEQGDKAPMKMDCCKDCCDKAKDKTKPAS